ncbi:MAG: HAD-IC family P-type ATPase, partial [Deltaproteobacteria bacterium]|nr:HAD-IC family P-type ATPase [Deltaproteobacteria bacterium]
MPLPSHPSKTPATDLATGLTHAEAAQRLAAVGANEIGSSRLKSRLIELAKIFLDPMGLMLLGLAALHAILGARGDAIILLIAWLPVTAVDVVLELRASVALKALQGLLSPVAKVLREGAVREVSIRDLVPGDLLLFEEGQTLPADGRVVEGEGLTVNESALTGESVPIEKDPGQVFFSGTQILAGRGVGQIEVTGRQTRLGKITETLQDVQGTASPLKRKVDRLVRVVLLAAVVLAAVLLAVELVRTHDLVQSLIVALTFGMSAVPEEFPLVFALYLSLGAWRLARRKVLVKSLPSVEALGSADVLCTDKTGTLTEGRFQLTELRGLRATDRTTWEAALMACEPRPVDAMEVAIHAMGSAHLDALKAWSL